MLGGGAGRVQLHQVAALVDLDERARLDLLVRKAGRLELTGRSAPELAARYRAALASLPRRWTGYVVRGLNRSPLVARRRLEQSGAALSR